MAELEVAKHTKKIYKIWNSKAHSLLHKLTEFFIEIITIVFAVSFSIWLHDRSEHKHQQKEVKEFLTGLKEDLLSDMREMTNDKDSYLNQSMAFNYILSIKPKQSLLDDSLKKYQVWLFNTTRLQQNNGRFEGFKSSGKLGTIEDKKLQDNIMDLYQEDIPDLLVSTDAYISRKNQLLDYIMRNRKSTTDSTTNMTAILHAYEAQNISSSLVANTNEIIERYDRCMEKMRNILAQIQSRYKE